MLRVLAVLLVVFMVFTFLPTAAYSDAPAKKTKAAGQQQLTKAEYNANMEQTLGRGSKNILTCWTEFPPAMQDHCGEGTIPGVNILWGAGAGLLMGLRRLGSGAWDMIAAFIPNQQQGMPVTPETRDL